MTETMLQFEGLSYRFPGSGRQIGPLQGAVHAGERVGLIGPNGAGKSTLLRLLTGFAKADRGRILLQGQPLSALTPRDRAQLLAVVPQSIGLQVALSVEQVVGLGRLAHQELWERFGWAQAASFTHRQALEGAMQATDTGSLRCRLFSSLSGGEAQRVLLAMALAQDSPILLLDEPTAHLDPGHGQQILRLLQDLAMQHGKSVIMAHHDLTTVGLYSDTLWLLAEGRMVAHGPSEEVLASRALRDAYGMEFLTVRHPVSGRSMLFSG